MPTAKKKSVKAAPKKVAAPSKKTDSKKSAPVKVAAKAKPEVKKASTPVTKSAKPSPKAPIAAPVAKVEPTIVRIPAASSSKKKIPAAIIPSKPSFDGLDGKIVRNILVTQPRPDNDKSPYFDIARRFKLNIDFRPFFEIQGITAKDFRRYRIQMHEHTAIIFTSRNAVDHFFRIITEMKTPISSEMKYICTTEAIGLYLQKFIQYRKRKVFYGDGSMKDLLHLISKHKDGERYLLPCGDTPNADITNYLKAHNYDYIEALCFRNTPCEIKDIKVENYDLIVFFSPSGLEALLQNFPKFKQKNIKFGAFGTATCQAIKDQGFALHLPGPQAGLPSMSSVIEAYMKENKAK